MLAKAQDRVTTRLGSYLGRNGSHFSGVSNRLQRKMHNLLAVAGLVEAGFSA